MSRTALTAMYSKSLLLDFADKGTEHKYRLYQQSARLPTKRVVCCVVLWSAAAYCGGVCSALGASCYLAAAVVQRTNRWTAGLAAVLGSLAHREGMEMLPLLILCTIQTGLSSDSSWALFSLFVLLRTFIEIALGVNRSLLQIVAVAAGTYLWERQNRDTWKEIDVSLRKEMELESLLNKLTAGVAVIDSRMRTIYANNQAKSLFAESVNPQLKSLCEGSWKTDRKELIEIQPHTWVSVTAQRISWNTVNALLLSLSSASQFVSTFQTLCSVNRYIWSEVNTLQTDLMRDCFEMEDENDIQALQRVQKARNRLYYQQCRLQALTGSLDDSPCSLNFRTEVLNAIELCSELATEKEMVISLTFEQGIPRIFEGNKSATAFLFSSAYEFALQASVLSTVVSITVLVSGVGQDSVSLMTKLEFDVQQSAAEHIASILNGEVTVSEESDEQSLIEGFQQILQLVSGACRASVKTNASGIVFWFRYPLQIKPREALPSVLIPSETRHMLSTDKFLWDFRPLARKDSKKKSAKRGSLRMSSRLERTRTEHKNLKSLETVVEQLLTDKSELDTPGTEGRVHVDAEVVRRDVSRHPCDIAAIDTLSAPRPLIHSPVVS